MDNFLFPELTNRAPSRIRKLRAHKRRPKPLIPFFGPGGEGQADEVPLPTPTPPVMTPRGPILKNEPERIKAVNTDQRAVFRVAANPNATDSNPFFVDIDDGKDAVAKFGGIIEMEAKKQGVDPDLVKAIMFAENARGNRLGLDQAFQDLGFANTFLPMNINPKIWSPLGINRKTADDPRVNIRTSVRLIKRLRDRIENPTAAKIGSV